MIDFDESREIEAAAFANFEKRYYQQSPPPRPRPTIGMGWQFYLALLWAVASVIAMSLRTASEFYRAEVLSGMNETAALFSSSVVLIAVEGGIVIAAAIKAAKSKTFSTFLLYAGIFLATAISIVAGVNNSLGVIQGLNPSLTLYVRYGVVVALGAGGSLLAWVSGEVVGARIAIVLSERALMANEHRLVLEEYRHALLRAWDASDERTVARSSVRSAARQVRSLAQQNEQNEQGERARRVRSPANQTNADRTNPAKREKIIAYVQEMLTAEQRTPGPSEIARVVGVTKSYAHDVLANINGRSHE